MLTVDEALDVFLRHPLPRHEERVDLSAALGRTIAQDICADHDAPEADLSAMDGFAVRAEDLNGDAPASDCFEALEADSDLVWMPVVETIPAGRVPEFSVPPGSCSRIMTGAWLPEGANAVVMREQVRDEGNRVGLPRGARRGQHVRRRGEEYRTGAVLIAAGTTLSPGHLAILASQGLATVPVMKRPVVVILATGDELVPPGRARGPGQIFASNTAALAAWVEQSGGVARDGGIVPDTLEGTRAALRAALAQQPDLIITTGGVSVGDFDFVKDALASEGAEMQFWKIRMKPGKPVAFGHFGGTPAIGLPGNPVSCQIGFLEFVRPMIRTALGDTQPFLPVVTARLVGNIRKKPSRAEFVRASVHIDPQGVLCATPLEHQGSGMVSTMADANALILMAAASIGADEGDRVSVQLLAAGLKGSTKPSLRWSGRCP